MPFLICCLLFYGMWKHLFLILLQLVCSKRVIRNKPSTSPLKLRITDFRRRDFTQRFTWRIIDQLKSLSYVKNFVYMPSAFKNNLIYSKEMCEQYMLYNFFLPMRSDAAQGSLKTETYRDAVLKQIPQTPMDIPSMVLV